MRAGGTKQLPRRDELGRARTDLVNRILQTRCGSPHATVPTYLAGTHVSEPRGCNLYPDRTSAAAPSGLRLHLILHCSDLPCARLPVMDVEAYEMFAELLAAEAEREPSAWMDLAALGRVVQRATGRDPRQ